MFLALNFCGNHALTADPRVPISRSWLYSFCRGVTNGAATEAARGGQTQSWPLARLVEQGCALASFCSGDLDADRPNVSDGLFAWRAGGDPARNAPADRGSIAAWAWAFTAAWIIWSAKTTWTAGASPWWATPATAGRRCSRRHSTGGY